MWARPVFMDESPGGEMDCSPDSTGGTPYGRGMKRPCDEELDAILEAGPRTKRMEMTPCQTPIHSSNLDGSARMCTGTPLCTTPLNAYQAANSLQRNELGLRWGSASSLGPRR